MNKTMKQVANLNYVIVPKIKMNKREANQKANKQIEEPSKNEV